MEDSIAHRQPPLLKFASTAFVIIWLIIAAFPFLWTVWGSFKVEGDFFSRETWLNAVFGVKTTPADRLALHLAAATMAPGSPTACGAPSAIPSSSRIFVTIISLTFGTLGGYALARSGRRYSFVILIVALVFRAMPHITLVSGYLLPFFQLNVWGYAADRDHRAGRDQPALHAVDAALVLPVDPQGSRRERAWSMAAVASRRSASAVIPVMWPGVITTGLFSFLLAYNDFAVTSMLLSEGNQTMVPRIASFMGSIEQTGKVMYAVAAVVSATVPLFILVMFFQRQIVSGLTAGAVKG